MNFIRGKMNNGKLLLRHTAVNNCAVNPPDSSVWDIRRYMTFSESHEPQAKNGVPKYKFDELHIII